MAVQGEWFSVFKELPADGQVVWVRVLQIYGEPVLAVFNLGTMTFLSSLTSVRFRAIECARWRPYFP